VTEILIFSLMYKPIFLPSITYCICDDISWRTWNLVLVYCYALGCSAALALTFCMALM